MQNMAAHGGSDQVYQRICVEPQGPIKHDEPLGPTPGAIKTGSAPGKVVIFVDLPQHEFRLLLIIDVHIQSLAESLARAQR
jgi:hypothetical protein